jgi:hypothetical protein
VGNGHRLISWLWRWFSWSCVMAKVRKALFAIACGAGVLLAIIQYVEMLPAEQTPASLIVSSR